MEEKIQVRKHVIDVQAVINEIPKSKTMAERFSAAIDIANSKTEKDTEAAFLIIFGEDEIPKNKEVVVKPIVMSTKETIMQVLDYIIENNEIPEVKVPADIDRADTLNLLYSIMTIILNSYARKNDLRKLKKCPYCNSYFIAKDTKRKICYEIACKNEYHKTDMKNRRDKDPIKYC